MAAEGRTPEAMAAEGKAAANPPEEADPSARGKANAGFAPYMPSWAFEAMEPGLESLRASATELSALSDSRAAAPAWRELAVAAGRAYEPTDPRSLAAFSRSAREALEGYGGGGEEIWRPAEAAAEFLASEPGQDSAEAIYALETAILFSWSRDGSGTARKAMKELADRSGKALGLDHPQTLSARLFLARELAAEGEHVAAAAALINIISAAGGARPGGARLAAAARAVLASEMEVLGKFGEAGALHGEALAALEENLPEGNTDRLAAMHNFALFLERRGERGEALRLLEAAVERGAVSLGGDSPFVSELSSALGRVRAAAEADAVLEAEGLLGLFALDAGKLERELGADHPRAMEAAAVSAELHLRLGRYSDAGDAFRDLLERRGRIAGMDAPETLQAAAGLAEACWWLGERERARELWLQVLEGRRRTLGPGHPETVEALNSLAFAMDGLGDHAGAFELLRGALESQELLTGPDSEGTLAIRVNLAAARRGLGDLAGAWSALVSALESEGRLGAGGFRLRAYTAANLGEIALERGDPGSAAFFFKLAVSGVQAARGGLEALDARLTRSWIPTVDFMHRKLFDLLMREGRIDEALAVLMMLKDDELAGLDLSGPGAGGVPASAAGSGRSSPSAAEGNPAGGAARISGPSAARCSAARAGDASGTREGGASGGRPAGDSGDVASDQRARRQEPPEAPSGRAPAPPAAGSGKAAPGHDSVKPAAGYASDAPSLELFAGTPDEAPYLRYLEAVESAAALEAERARLLTEREQERNPGGAARLAELESRIGEGKAAFSALCDGIPELLGPVSPARPSAAGKALMARRVALEAAGGGAALLYAVSAPEKLYLVVVGTKVIFVADSPAGSGEVARLALAFRDLVQDPSKDPRPAGKALYDLVVAPAAEALEREGVRSIVMSLDGALRYVPAAAMWDGERWLAEKYPTSVFTSATLNRLSESPRGGPAHARALGLTAARRGLPPLPGAAAEVVAVVKTPESPQGALEGEILMDEAFDRAALSRSLASGAPVVHVASHFLLDPSSGRNSVLLLGDGGVLSLAEMRSARDLDFTGLDLITLSACDTGSGARANRDGREVESLGETLQLLGASAVLAALVPVDDMSAPELMREFYRRRYVDGESKSDALRSAQLAVMRQTGLTAEPSRRGAPLGKDAAPKAAPLDAPPWEGKGFSHPYYWSSFVVIGDWR
jgi:CHAT domain-containing protein